MKLKGIGEKTAIKIDEYRQKTPFQTIEDLMNIQGIGEKTYLRLRGVIYVYKKGKGFLSSTSFIGGCFS